MCCRGPGSDIRLRLSHDAGGTGIRCHGVRNGSRILAENNPANALPNCCRIEIDEQTKWPAAKFQVGQGLRLLHRKHGLDRFHLYNNGPIYKDVEPVDTLELDAFVNNRHRFLDSCDEAAKRQLASQSNLVRLISSLLVLQS